MNIAEITRKEYFIACSLVTADQFISFCKDRSVKVSREQSEQFEKLGIFFPIARAKLPTIKIKVEYLEGNRYKHLGKLEDGEEWTGGLKEEYAHFWFHKDYAENWLEEGILWDPRSRAFEEWKHFRDKKGRECVISYYSKFQIYALYHIVNSTKCELRAEWWYGYSEEDKKKIENGQVRDIR